MNEQTNIKAYLAIIVKDNESILKAKDFAEQWKSQGGHEVVVMYKGEKAEMTMLEFLERMGFEDLPCSTCNGTGEMLMDELAYGNSDPISAGTGIKKCIDCN